MREQSMSDADSEARDLTDAERLLVRWLLAHGTTLAINFLPQVANARVASKCGCGCASIDFSIDGTSAPITEGMNILADYIYLTASGQLCGVFLFEQAGLLAGLEVWSVDGHDAPTALPAIDQLLAPSSSALHAPPA